MKKMLALTVGFLILGFAFAAAQDKTQAQEKAQVQTQVKAQTKAQAKVQTKSELRLRNRTAFVDENGDGINDFARDADGDGIPNCQDPDWSRPLDGSGYRAQAGKGAGIGHLSVSLLAAQGIGHVVGLSASAVRQWIVAGENPFLSVEEFYFVQNPSADSFSWEGDQLTGRISLNIPWDVTLKTGYTYADRTFPGVESMSLDGVPLGLVRNDRRRLLEARLQKDFRRLSVFVAYSYVDNTSTDPLFVWKSHFITGGFEWNLPAGRRKGGA